METCDVLIVGGGPSGSSCAWQLTRAGLDVVVVDKAVFPRDKVCAGWITPAVVDELQLDRDDYRQQRTLQPITGFRTSVLGGLEICTEYDRVVSYGIRRCEFDHYLLNRCGARLRLGEPLRALERTGDQWVVNHAIQAPLLIGAGGHFCPVARQLTKSPVAAISSNSSPEEQSAAHEPDERTSPAVVAQEVEFQMTPEQIRRCRVDGATPELFFCDDLRGYGWCFRKGDYLNVGLGRENEKSLSSHVEQMCELLISRGRIPPDTPRRFHGHAYHLYRHAPRALHDDAVLLIGDAANLAYSQSGEGIRPAVESGLLAARAVLQAAGDYRRGVLDQLQTEFVARFGRRESSGNVLSGLLPEHWIARLGARLMSSRWFTRHVVLDRWFLHATVPPLTV